MSYDNFTVYETVNFDEFDAATDYENAFGYSAGYSDICLAFCELRKFNKSKSVN